MVGCVDIEWSVIDYFPFYYLLSKPTPSAARSLQDNYHFLFPITKSDVCSQALANPGIKNANCRVIPAITAQGNRPVRTEASASNTENSHMKHQLC
jgi:hypothetical protein